VGKYTVTMTEDLDTVEALHTLCLPGDEFPDEDDIHQAWLVAEDDEDETPVGFATIKVVDEDTVFMQRSGVLPHARGHRLQRRLLQQRERWARECDIKWVVTYTSYRNHASITTLIKAGYRFYLPEQYWAGRFTHYFFKAL
jgi:GNAT superfamily N-acetyltransferase